MNGYVKAGWVLIAIDWLLIYSDIQTFGFFRRFIPAVYILDWYLFKTAVASAIGYNILALIAGVIGGFRYKKYKDNDARSLMYAGISSILLYLLLL